MARVKVWIEAMEEYLIRQNLCKRENLQKLSDDDLSEFYYKIIEEKGLSEDAKIFLDKYCMQYK